ncbi:MAG: VanZ family protein [Colwellia sp.]|uniref:VanZ family protein n=1 Tax=Colwellia sp. TaxID=56799 RepID=UPI0025BCFA3E|nr:VanZ family protein [Colwellia sp.]MCJ8293245.1 VanZ family protein [Colwellia sp.]NQZ27319.1 VanZ family protein [Colwellia sp.]
MTFILNLIKHYWLFITVFLLTAIATLSLWPAEYLPKVPGSDKTHHFISYGALMLPVALRKPKHWLWIALGFAAFSGAIELIQPYVNRYGEWLDMAANVAGLACGIILAKILEYFFQNTPSNI